VERSCGAVLDGKPRTAAPLRKVMRAQDVACIDMSRYGKDTDQGIDCPLISPWINGSSELVFGLYRLAPGEYHPRHLHPSGAELYYVQDGTCVITVDDDQVECHPGTAVYLPAGTVHAVRTRPHESTTIVYAFDHSTPGLDWLE
jgi:quercetin dioxygenase-like cupin family protein